MKPQRVLIIGHTYVAPVNRLKFNFMARDPRFEVMLVTPKKWRNYLTKADNIQTENKSNYKIKFVDVWFGRHPVTYIIPGLSKIIRKFKPHLIYCEQEPICIVSLQVAILAKNIPVVYFSWENIARKDARYRLFALVLKVCHKKSLFMVAGSKEAADVLRKQGYTKKIYVTPLLGVSENLFFPSAQEQFRKTIPSCKFLIGYVGRFIETKGISTLLNAARLLDEDVDWHLVLLGGGPQEKELEELSRKLAIEDRVTFHHAVSHDLVPQFINSLDVLVLPSRTTPTWKEQFGHVLIEAMACGVPVVGSSSGEIPNVIGNAGLVFNEGDAVDLSSKLSSLYMDSQQRTNLEDRGLKRVREKYTDERIAANMIAICEIALEMERKSSNTLEAYFH